MVRTVYEWEKLSSAEKAAEWRKWNPQSDKALNQLMSEILASYCAKYPDVISACWGNVHGEYQLIVEMENLDIPKPYLGIPVRRAPKS